MPELVVLGVEDAAARIAAVINARSQAWERMV